MSLGSVVRFRNYCIRKNQGRSNASQRLTLRMKAPIRGVIQLREVQSDFYTFGDVIEEDVYGVALRHLPECSTIIDLGANIGLAALYLANAYPTARIFAVEPNRDNFELLKLNVKELTEDKRCVPLQAAAWSTRKALAVDPQWKSGAYNAYRLLDKSPPQNASEAVEGFTMEELIASSGFQEVDLLKVDIEGAELELFRDDVAWLARVKAIAIEFHGRSREESDFDRKLAANGFSVCEENAHTLFAVKKA